jgi:hypothetical protein
MPSARPAVTVNIKETNTEDLLARLPYELRGKYLVAGIRAGLSAVKKRAKQLVPEPGYPGDKPGLKPLRDTIGSAVREYGDVVVGVVGPEYPAGAHGHLVEHGHKEVLWGVRTGDFVEGAPFMEPAVDSTLEEQKAAVERRIKAGIEKEIKAANLTLR